MDIETLRDEAARLMGWRLIAECENIQRTGWINERYEGCPLTGRTVLVTKDGDDTHPLPLTLDAISAMPKGWDWNRMMWDGKPQWVATRVGEPWVSGVCVPDTGNELHDRLALLVAVLRAAPSPRAKQE